MLTKEQIAMEMLYARLSGINRVYFPAQDKTDKKDEPAQKCCNRPRGCWSCNRD